jgi:hypothetical protein
MGTTMLVRLAEHIAACLERAAKAEKAALEASDPVARRDHEVMANAWRHLAESYQFVEGVERFVLEMERAKKQTAITGQT